jgi:small-conductance mechanosensitive channel
MRFSFALATTLVTILLWLFFAATAKDPMFGVAPTRTVVEAAAVAASAMLFVTFGGWLVLSLAASGERAAAPTGLQRVLVYGLLSFVACFAALRYFDFDLGAVLTTSAIVSAAIAFAMQPTLGSMISGIALNIDGMPRVGDGIMLDGQSLQVESLNWRRVVGRRADGSIVIIPNARLADNTLEILPHDAPIRAEIVFQAPASAPPQRIIELAAETVSDFAHIDVAQPIVVSPVEYDANQTSLRYRIQYRVHRFRDVAELEGEVLKRLWYAFQRERLWCPAEAAEAPGQGAAAWRAPAEVARLLRDLKLPWPALASAETALALATHGEVLLFAPGERLTLPQWTEGRRLLLLRGEAVRASEIDTLYRGDDALPGIATPGFLQSVALHRVRRELAHHIGPYAEHALRRAARAALGLEDVVHALKVEIPDEEARASFVERVLPERPPGFGPGLILATCRNAAGSLVCETPLRARGEVTILALPPASAETGGGARTAAAS